MLWLQIRLVADRKRRPLYEKDRSRDEKVAVRDGNPGWNSVPISRFSVPKGRFSDPKKPFSVPMDSVLFADSLLLMLGIRSKSQH